MKDEEEAAFRLYQEDVHMSLVHYSSFIQTEEGWMAIKETFLTGNEGKEGFV